MDTRFDVVIVGGGMVGATIACALGGSNLSVALLESAYPEELTKSVSQGDDIYIHLLLTGG